MLAQAEIIEIAENVAERRDRKTGQASQASGSGSNPSKGKQPPADGSVQAVTFGLNSRQCDRKKNHGEPRSDNNNGQRGSQRGPTPQSWEGTPANNSSNKGKSSGGSVPPKNNSKSKYQPRRINQLSDKEKAEYWAAGRCFNCGKEGHMSRNCPENETVRSQGNGPPGASSFNVEPVPLTETDSEEDIEILDSLPLGAMFFGDSGKMTSVNPWPIKEWRDHYPYWNEPQDIARQHIGNCYAMMVDTILTLEAPFPGDTRYDAPRMRPELRFYVKWLDHTCDYVLTDRLMGSRLVLSRDSLENPEFDISYWYTEQRCQALGLTEEISHNCCIGDAPFNHCYQTFDRWHCVLVSLHQTRLES